MGSLIPIGGGADGEIQNLLNTAFNASNIKIVRTKVASEDLLDGNHHLHRIAYRLGAYPVGNYGTDDAKGKWFYFLNNILKTADHNGVKTAASIKKILSYAMHHATGADKVVRVVFQAIQGGDATADHFVSSASGVATEPGNPINDADIAGLVDTTGTLTITLVCPAPLPNQSAPVPNQTSDLDRDPQGNIIEKPPIKIFTPQDLSPPVLSPATRKPEGKGAYMGRAKTGKKAKKTTKAKKTKKRK
jgi:hypothetical protein